ncbi:MAG: hypothetical protein LQ342_003162 [Letrouitia transgressa]|nr:MAG: hypothetical protein LQ342_003162 [Letrouitia transgressa]
MNGTSKPLINLLRGWPNPSLLPVTQIKNASLSALSDPKVSAPALLYGPDPGYEPLRENIAGWLTRFYQLPPISPKRICISGGGSQNIACILQVFSDPSFTKQVWMVSPTYFLACPIFQDNGFYKRLRSVPEDEEGIDIDFLKAKLLQSDQETLKREGSHSKAPHAWRKSYRHLIYAVPTFSNPSSRTMSLRRREQLVRVAREHDALIITDDVYDHLQWPAVMTPGETPPSLEHAVLPRVVDIDRQLDGGPDRPDADGFGNAVSSGTFSKIVGPGTRCGWAEGTEKFTYGLSQCGSSTSGGAPSQMTSTFIDQLLRSGDLEQHISLVLRPAYSRRYHAMIDAVEEHLLPLGIKLPRGYRDVVGGYFIWFALPEPLRADAIAQQAKEEENLIVGPGSLFQVYDDARVGDLECQVRLCFAWEEEQSLVEGIVRLGKVIRQCKQGGREYLVGKILNSAQGAFSDYS